MALLMRSWIGFPRAQRATAHCGWITFSSYGIRRKADGMVKDGRSLGMRIGVDYYR